jgi:hypothetical protein
MTVWHAPLGRVIRGHVLDCNQKAFNRALREIDSRLYTEWNPFKVRGHGCWEIRIKPRRKTPLYRGTYRGAAFYELVDLEFDTVHHVLDCAFLNYDALRKLKEMDTYDKNHFVHNLEALEQEQANKVAEEAQRERRYNLRQHKSALHELYERVRSGQNLHRIIGEANWQLKVDSQS